MSLFGNLSPSQFLKRYWQKKPLLVRQAFPGFRDPITRDELAGLSCDPDVASRLVMERGGAKPWQVTTGPQKESRLRKLPPSHWTLLVQGVDREVPGVAALLDYFRFIPDWRIDDVMISFAPHGGTVGPHVDSYDVFLIQGQGRRRWRIDSQAPTALRPGLDLRILKQFKAEADWILEPGDMLYLPPGLAHYGIALEECLTYSIGFRAPSAMDLLVTAQQRLMQTDFSDTANARYSDPNLEPPRSSGEIPRAAVQTLRRLMEHSLQQLPEADFDVLIGEILTEPKGCVDSPRRAISVAQLQSLLAKGSVLVRSPGSRLGYVRRGTSTELFADGRRFPLTRSMAFAAPLLADHRHLSSGILSPHLRKRDFIRLLTELVNAGTLRLG